MLILTQKALNPSLVAAHAAEYYGFTQGPVTVYVTDQLSAKGPHRLYAAFAYMYTGNGIRNPTQEELAQFNIPKA